ncbi:MAG: nucleotidyltransferase domain-containing protein [Dehalococcoidales bacterium]|nr:nucleotidyltransferase domain-containing protein [Dehalococcoidales bacterium]
MFNPVPEFHLREISRRTGVSAPYVKKEMDQLREIGLVKETSQGNLKLFKINRDSPVIEDIKRIFLKTDSLGGFLSKELSELGEIQYALIYGSFARGDETESSDIDLLIIGEVNEESLITLIGNIEKKIGREVNYILWMPSEYEKKTKEGHHLLLDIIGKPFIMLIGDINEFRGSAKR